LKCKKKIYITSRALLAHIEEVSNIVTKKDQQNKKIYKNKK